MKTPSLTLPKIPRYAPMAARGGILLMVVVAIAVVLPRWLPIGVDWGGTFSQLDWADPYATPSFMNPPFTVLFLPHRFLPVHWGNALNFILNVGVILFAVHRLGGGRLALALVFTSPVFFDLCRTNNIDWLPLLGLTVGPQLGPVLLACKPQTLGGVVLIWAKKDWRVLLAPIGLVLLSFVVWGFWPLRVPGTNALGAAHNFSVFPLGLPYGIYLLWRAWKTDDALLGALATPLLVPYVAAYSWTTTLCVLTCRERRAGLWLYFAIWAFAVIETRRLGALF